MNHRLFTVFTRTPLHVGAGSSVGIVDSPVQRERHTRIPIIPGSSIKGVLRDCFANDDSQTQTRLFGSDTDTKDEDGKKKLFAGTLLIGEARVLAFPVRSAKHGFAWITCPLALARFARDAGTKIDFPNSLQATEAWAADKLVFTDKKQIVLEEYACTVSGKPDATVVDALANLTGDAVWQELSDRLVIVSDELFQHFVEHACEVVTRIKINDETGTVAKGALFSIEQVPSETLLYAVFSARSRNGSNPVADLATLGDKIQSEGVLQFGGDETVGLGFCSVQLLPEAK